MKNIIAIFFFSLLFCSEISADITSQLLKLNEMYRSGTITEEEFKKAKSILLKMDESKTEEAETKITKDVITVNTFRNHIKEFEKKELIFDDYRIYTHRPGGVKIKRLSDNKQLAVFSDNFKINYYNDGEGLFDFILDEKDQKIYVKFKGVELLKWEGRYVAKHNAHFFQLVTFNDEPFHYYIVLNGGKQVALNLKKFTKKIDKAVDKAKIRLAAKYNITLEQIELILKRRKDAKNKELEGIIGKKKDEILEEALRDSVDKELNKELAKQLEETIGQAMAKEFDAIIIEGMEAEFASLVDEAIQEAVSEGISQATAEAAIRAIMDVLGAGGSEAEAMAACRAIAGDAC